MRPFSEVRAFCPGAALHFNILNLLVDVMTFLKSVFKAQEMTKRKTFKIEIEGIGEVPCHEGERMLVAIERAPLHRQLAKLEQELPLACRHKACHICKAKILSGTYRQEKMTRSHISVEEEVENIVLVCATYPQSDIVLKFC